MNTQPLDPNNPQIQSAPVVPEIVQTPPVSEQAVNPPAPEAPTPEQPKPEVTAENPQTTNVATPTMAVSSSPAIADPVPATTEVSLPSPNNETPTAEPVKGGKLEETYVHAVDEAIDMFEKKPYEEEEKAEDLQIGYLKKRFGKDLKKSD